MAGENVIRRDVVQIAFEVMDNPMEEIQNMVNNLTDGASSAVDSIDEITAEARRAAENVSDISNSANDLSNVAQQAAAIAEDIEDVNTAATEAANSAQEMREPIEEVSESAREAEVRFSAMVKALASSVSAKIKSLPEIIQSSATKAREFASSLRAKVFDAPINGAKKLASNIGRIAKMNVSEVFTRSVSAVKKLGISITTNIDKGLGRAFQRAKELPGALKTTAVEAFGKVVGSLKDRFEEVKNSAKEVGDEAKSAASKAEGGFTVLKGVIADLISNGIMKLIDGVKNFAVESVKVGADFDSSMSEVAAISGATGDELQALRDTAKEYGKTTVFSASESADALKYMALAGWDANQSIDALPGILNLAAASGMELAGASDMVTDYLTAFNMEADQAAYFADVLAYAQSNSNTTAEMLGEAYKNCAANLNAAGQDMETTTALLSQMANQGLKGSEAGTALAAVMRDMTAKMENGAISVGNTSVAVLDAQGNFRDLTDIMKDVESATDGMTDGQRAVALQSTFTEESIKGMNLMLNAGIGEAEEFEESLRGSTGAAKDMADTMNDNLNGDMKNLQSQLEGVRIELYEKLEPALRKGVSVLSKMLGKVGEVASKIASWATSEKVVNKLKTAFTNVKNAVTPIVKAVGRVISAIFDFVTAESTINTVKDAFNRVKDVVSPIVGFVQGVIDKIAEFVTSESTINTVKDAFDKVKGVIEPIIDIIQQVIEKIIDFVTNSETVKSVAEGVKTAFGGIKTAISKIFSVAKKALGFISDHLNIILPLVEGVAAAWLLYKGYIIVTTAVMKAYAAVQAIVNAVMNANPIGLIITAIGLLIGIIILLIQNWDNVKTKASEVWESIKAIWGTVSQWFMENIITPIVTFFTGLWETISTIFTDIWNVITTAFSSVVTFVSDNVIAPIAGFFSGLWETITGIFSSVGEWFSEKFNAAVEGIKEVFGTVVEFFTGLWDDIKEIFTTIGTTIGNAIGDAFATVVNAVIDFAENTINGFIRAINAAINLINEIPGVSISKISELSIPRLAKGAIVDKPTIAQIGEDGKEAVVPLENNTGWFKILLKELSGGNYGGNYELAESGSTTSYKEYNEYNEYSPNFTLNMNGASATDDNKRKVKQWIKEAWKEVLDDLDNDNPPVQEV